MADSQEAGRTYLNKNMTLNPMQVAEMKEASKPLMKWIAENCHPHCEATVDCNSVTLTEGIATERTNEFLKD